MYPTGDRDPLPENEEDEDMLPEVTDFGRLGRPSCDACDPSEGRNLLSAEKGEEERNELCKTMIIKKCPIPVLLTLFSRHLSSNEKTRV